MLLNRGDDSASSKQPQIIDVRRHLEYAGGHVPHAVNYPLAKLENEIAHLDTSLPSYIICAGGYRSSAAASVLARHGFRNLHNVTGGTNGWIEAGYETEKTASDNS
ncbi:MAG: rhodanese-like domain-containing protein [Pyrinomonadaceae bacterium MAG19_C2-C3]|nr:rhodanese-like domain-containing protein [Pyrinomonadaceae bacterium MAG19_C2-C3]